MNGGFGKVAANLKGTQNSLITIGLEYPLLQLNSHLTYISKTKLVVLEISMQNLLRSYA